MQTIKIMFNKKRKSSPKNKMYFNFKTKKIKWNNRKLIKNRIKLWKSNLSKSNQKLINNRYLIF